MIVIRPSEIYISTANVDMRKSIDGLASLVQQRFRLDPLSDALFVFHNRHCDKIKMLYWDRDGFCLLYKRLENSLTGAFKRTRNTCRPKRRARR